MSAGQPSASACARCRYEIPVRINKALCRSGNSEPLHEPAQHNASKAEQDQRLARGQRLTLSQQNHCRVLSDAERDQGRLRDRLDTADVRLSVLLNAITDTGDRALIALQACQAYIRALGR